MSFSRVIKKYLQICWEFKKIYIPFILILTVGIVLTKIFPVFYKEIIDLIGEKKFDSATNILFLGLGIWSIGQIFESVSRSFGDHLYANMVQSASSKYINSALEMDYSFHASKSSGELISKVKRGELALFTMYSDVNREGISTIINFAVALASISFVSLKVTGVIFFTIIATIFVQFIVLKINIKYRRLVNKKNDRITSVMVDNLIAFQPVKVFGKEEYEKKRLSEEYRPWRKAFLDFAFTFRYLEASIFLPWLISTFLVIWFSIMDMKSGAIEVGAFAMILGFHSNVSTGLSDLVTRIRNLIKNYADLQEYFSIMELRPEIKDPENPKKIERFKGEIEFRNINFSYNKGSSEIIKNLNLKISAGETIALIGKSGGGKTTLTKLLMRFYELNSGEILIDGHNIRDFRQSELRQHIGLVPQDPVLFNETIGYNIGYPIENSSLRDIEIATKMASLNEFVESLDEKYDSKVGERGIKLSGGQKQRLAIARVMLENPEIIIFDEATSQLDSENEIEIQKAFKNLTKEKTTIVIAHRLSTIMNADRIVVIKDGEIEEIGKHKELLNKESGLYKKLWKMQTEGIIE